MATHSGILTWRIPWTEEPGRLQSMGSQRVRLDWTTNNFTFKLVLSEQPWALFHLSLHRSTHYFFPANLPELPSKEHNTTSSLRGLLPSESILLWDLPSPSGHQAWTVPRINASRPCNLFVFLLNNFQQKLVCLLWWFIFKSGSTQPLQSKIQYTVLQFFYMTSSDPQNNQSNCMKWVEEEVLFPFDRWGNWGCRLTLGCQD